VKVKLPLPYIKYDDHKKNRTVKLSRQALWNLALDENQRPDSHPGGFTQEERATNTHFRGRWMGPRAGLEAVVNLTPTIRLPRRKQTYSEHEIMKCISLLLGFLVLHTY